MRGMTMAMLGLSGAAAACTPKWWATEGNKDLAAGGGPSVDGSIETREQECASFTPGQENHKGLLLGLSVVDERSQSITKPVSIGCRSPIVIFVHGWSFLGDVTAFSHADLWQKRGFVTMVFRWHDLSGLPSFEDVFVKGSVTAAARLQSELHALYARLGSRYSGEIRLVGHSFGGKVAADVASKMGALDGTKDYDDVLSAAVGRPVRDSSVPIARLTLLDPAVFVDWTSAEMSICPMLRIGFERRGGGAEPKQEAPVQVEAGRLLALFSMIPKTTKVEVYASNVASPFAYSLARKYAVQTLTKASIFGCHVSFEGLNLFEVHSLVVPGYLSSIAEQPPRLVETAPEGGGLVEVGTLNSAAVPTDKLVTMPGWYVLKSGQMGERWGEQSFVKNDIPGSYLKLEASEACMRPGASFADCAGVLKYVKTF